MCASFEIVFKIEFGFKKVDRVRYSDKTPWPTVADGSGEKLYRCDPSKIGNDASKFVLFLTLLDVHSFENHSKKLGNKT